MVELSFWVKGIMISRDEMNHDAAFRRRARIRSHLFILTILHATTPRHAYSILRWTDLQVLKSSISTLACHTRGLDLRII